MADKKCSKRRACESTAEERWALDLICCGRDDGTQVFRTSEDADEFRESYCAPVGWWDSHVRQAIKRRARPGETLGFHDAR